jgi:hypothetical protein
MGKQRTRLELWLCCGVTLLSVAVVALSIAIIFMATTNDDVPSGSTPSSGDTSTPGQQKNAEQTNISSQLLAEFKPMNIRDNLRWLTKTLHVAGTPENSAVMHQLAAQYESYGLAVKIHEYQVLLSYPNYSMPNTIHVQLGGELQWDMVSNGTAQRLGPPEAIAQQGDPRALNWWNGYAKDGMATGPLFYVNYGSLPDYTLLDSHNISLQGAIVLARYDSIIGVLFRRWLRMTPKKVGGVLQPLSSEKTFGR